MEQFTILDKYPNLIEAEMVRSILESYGIEAFVLDSNLAYNLGAYITQWYRVQVFTEDLEKAKEILESQENNLDIE